MRIIEPDVKAVMEGTVSTPKQSDDSELHSLKKSFDILQAERIELHDQITELRGKLDNAARVEEKLRHEIILTNLSRNAYHTKSETTITALKNVKKQRQTLQEDYYKLAGALGKTQRENKELEETIAKKDITIEWFNEQYLKAKEILNADSSAQDMRGVNKRALS